MGDARIVYGLALGKQNNWQTKWQNRTDGAITQADTSPDVTNKYLVYTINSGSTTISDFDLTTPAGTSGNQSGLFEGKVLKVFFTDSVTTVSGARIYLADTNQTFGTNAVLDLIYHNSAWYEMSRCNPKIGGTGIKTYTFAGSAGSASVDFVSTLVLIPTVPASMFVSLSGGYVGQEVNIVMGSGATQVRVSSNGNILMSGTEALVISTSGNTTTNYGVGFKVLKATSTTWVILSRNAF